MLDNGFHQLGRMGQLARPLVVLHVLLHFGFRLLAVGEAALVRQAAADDMLVRERAGVFDLGHCGGGRVMTEGDDDSDVEFRISN